MTHIKIKGNLWRIQRMKDTSSTAAEERMAVVKLRGFAMKPSS